MRPEQRRPIGNTGVSPTILGFGGASIGNLHRPVTEEDARDAILAAYDIGVRYFDTAPLYGAGLGEQRMGGALAADGVVLSTKVGHSLTPSAETAPDRLPNRVRFDYSYDATLRSVEASLRRLSRSTLDVAFIHDIDPYNHGAAQPDVFRAAMEGAWRALAALREAGVVRAIGVGVNDVAVCEACLAAADIDCFLLAGRYTLLDTAALPRLLPACERRGVGVVLGAPFNTGLLARGAAADTTWNHQAPPEPVRRRVAAIERVGLEHGVSLMAAALQFPLAHPVVVSVLPGIRSAAQAMECGAAIAAPIPAAFWDALRRDGLIDENAPVPNVGGP